jgi:spore maturation protein CgeB
MIKREISYTNPKGLHMRIFYASDTTPNPFIQSDLWRNNLFLPLVDLGHDVIEFQYDLRSTFQNLFPADPLQKGFIERNRPHLSEELLKQIRAAHAVSPIQLFFSYFNDACVLPETIDEIRDMGIKTVNWYCNGSYQLHMVSTIAPHYDWCLVPEEFRLRDYVAMGATPIYCQEAANPNIYKPYDVPVEFDVTFVGQAYGERPAYINHLLGAGIDVHVWGPRWELYTIPEIAPINQPPVFQRAANFGRALKTADGWQYLARRLGSLRQKENQDSKPAREMSTALVPGRIVGDVLSDLQMIQMYSRSKINLGFSTCGETYLSNQKILQIRLRDFEVPMSGGFYMVEYMEELEAFYEIGKEIVCYKSVEDLIDKIKYYLSNDREREAVRRAGYERCLRDHTWHKRFAAAFKQMDLPL